METAVTCSLETAPWFSQPVPWFSQPVSWFNQPVPWFSQPVPWFSQPAPWFNQPVPWFNQPVPAKSVSVVRTRGRGAERVPGCLLGDRCWAASLETSLWRNMLLGCSWSKHGQGADSAWLFLSRMRKSVTHCTSFIMCVLSLPHWSRISSIQNHHSLNLFKNRYLFSSVQLIGTWL